MTMDRKAVRGAAIRDRTKESLKALSPLVLNMYWNHLRLRL